MLSYIWCSYQWIIGVLIVFILSMSMPISAQDSTYPTVTALNQLSIPSNDPIDIARRLRGIDVNYFPPSQAPDWQIGDRKLFSIINSGVQQEQIIEADVRAISEHVVLWVESTVQMNPAMAEQFTDIVDTAIVQAVQDLWGVIEPAGIDGDSRLYILMVTGLDPAIAGYFSDIHAFPRSVLPNSNQHEMMMINLSAISDNNILSPTVFAIIVHEYQHVLRHFIDKDEETWLDEGFSTYTEHRLGWEAGRSSVVNFLNQPDVQVNHWISDSRRFPRYGAVFLLVNYFVDRFGDDALRQLSNEAQDGWRGLDKVLRDVADLSADEFFADWTLANYFLDVNKGYGYPTLWHDLPSARPIASIVNYPSQVTGQTPQYSTDYYTALRFDDADSFTITLSQPETVGLIPTQAYDGEQFFYAVPADYSDATLTRDIDLSSVNSATLSFRTWYDLEEFWDYAYVMVSVDDGDTWNILPGSSTRDRNPYNRAYGIGYTGKSFGWVQEMVSLDDYAGQNILIRFEAITDAASIRHGIAIDDLHIEAINYSDSFESDSDTWDVQGWIQTDNRLPQRSWVQVVQAVGDELTVSRWIADSTTQSWTIQLVDNAEMALIAISPIAQQTMVEASYTLDIDIR